MRKIRLHVAFCCLQLTTFVRNAEPFAVVRPLSRASQAAIRPGRTTELLPGYSSKDRSLIVALQSSADNGDFVEAQDLEALQALFGKYCDSDGLMTKSVLGQVPAIAELVENGALLEGELRAIWERAPKFPDPESPNDRIDVDSFVQIYRDVDDLFEDEEGDEQPKSPDAAKADESHAGSAPAPETADEKGDETMEAELETIFDALCNKEKLVGKESLRNWDEVSTLLEDGLLGDDEFEQLWDRTKKSPGSPDLLDVDGFLSFTVALDALFDFEDDDMEEGEESANAGAAAKAAQTAEPIPPAEPLEEEDVSRDEPPSAMVEGDDLTPEQLFLALAGQSDQVDAKGLLRWVELEEMLSDGDLVQAELDELLAAASKGTGALDLDSFLAFYQSVDELFEEVDEEDDGDESGEDVVQSAALKSELLNAIKDLDDPGLLPCGLDATEVEQREILSIVSDLEKQSTNLIIERGGAIDMTDLAGTWDLLYSSSAAMKFNKGLSGIGGSFPNGRCGGIKQKLTAAKYLADMEYIERIDVTPSSASFDVRVNGDWELRTSVSLFTGQPSIVMTVVPDRVEYGPTSTRADHWKSLGPMNMLDVSYLDDDLRIMRGNTAVDNIFIFRKSSP